MTATFTARHHGRCADCDERVHEGDQVRFVDDQLVHADCGDHMPTEKPVALCPRCFIALPTNGVCCDE